jgi:t-SNARE complex subunit (syntaxin)
MIDESALKEEIKGIRKDLKKIEKRIDQIDNQLKKKS